MELIFKFYVSFSEQKLVKVKVLLSFSESYINI